MGSDITPILTTKKGQHQFNYACQNIFNTLFHYYTALFDGRPKKLFYFAELLLYYTHIKTLKWIFINSPKYCHLGDMVSSSFLYHCKGGGIELSSQNCCSGLVLIYRSPAFWNQGPPVAIGNGHYPEVTIHQPLQSQWHSIISAKSRTVYIKYLTLE